MAKGEGASGLGSTFLKWFGPVTTILAFIVGGTVAYANAQTTTQRVAVIEKEGSEPAKAAMRKATSTDVRVDKVEDALAKLAETLDRVDRRVALMACKQDRRECR